jgi:aminoglycoside 3-N-acetyltransferase
MHASGGIPQRQPPGHSAGRLHPMDENGEPKWQKYLDIALNSDDFIKVGEIMKKKGLVRELDIGPCHAMFFSAVNAIDEATHFFSRTQVYDLYR